MYIFTSELLILSFEHYYKYSSERNLTNIFNMYLCLFLIQYKRNLTRRLFKFDIILKYFLSSSTFKINFFTFNLFHIITQNEQLI